jgi:hypothetical protein
VRRVLDLQLLALLLGQRLVVGDLGDDAGDRATERRGELVARRPGVLDRVVV